jgi:hypothetical protein
LPPFILAAGSSEALRATVSKEAPLSQLFQNTMRLLQCRCGILNAVLFKRNKNSMQVNVFCGTINRLIYQLIHSRFVAQEGRSNLLAQVGQVGGKLRKRVVAPCFGFFYFQPRGNVQVEVRCAAILWSRRRYYFFCTLLKIAER